MSAVYGDSFDQIGVLAACRPADNQDCVASRCQPVREPRRRTAGLLPCGAGLVQAQQGAVGNADIETALMGTGCGRETQRSPFGQERTFAPLSGIGIVNRDRPFHTLAVVDPADNVKLAAVVATRSAASLDSHNALR